MTEVVAAMTVPKQGGNTMKLKEVVLKAPEHCQKLLLKLGDSKW